MLNKENTGCPQLPTALQPWDPNDWTETNRIVATGDAGGNNFGYSIGLSDDYAAINAYGWDSPSSNSGQVFFYNYSGNQPTPTQCAPDAPTGLGTQSKTAFTLTLQWTDNAANEDGYYVYSAGNSWKETVGWISRHIGNKENHVEWAWWV